MSKGEKSRDWDKELADIDKLLAAGPAVPTTPPAPQQGAASQAVRAAPSGVGAAPARVAVPGRHAQLFTWLRLVLGLALGAGMTQWPYTHGCGLNLYLYLGAVAAVLVAGVWSGISSWKTRSGFAHFLSVGLVIWGGVLAAREILPRIGYAKQTAEWVCRVPSVPPSTVP